MSWVNVLKKKVKKKEVKKVKKKKKIELNDDFYDEDEQFDIKYGDNLFDIEDEFKRLLKIEGLPFLNKLSFDYTFTDFIKNNSREYYNVIDEVETLNNEDDEYTSDEDDDY